MNSELGWTTLPNKLVRILEGIIVSLNHLLFTRDDAILVTTTGNGGNLNHVSMKVPQHDMFTLQNKQILTFKLSFNNLVAPASSPIHCWFLFRHMMYVYIYIHTWYMLFLPNPTKTIPHNSLFLHQKKEKRPERNHPFFAKEPIWTTRTCGSKKQVTRRGFTVQKPTTKQKNVVFQHVWSHVTLW